jgi:Tol biopolymer transport system component
MESTRPRPDGTLISGERQLIAADIQTGQLYWIGVLAYENTAQYGKYHIGVSSAYHADYSPKTNALLYYDMTSHNLYLRDFNTRKNTLLWSVATGTIGDPPSISEDGSRAIIYVRHPGPAATDTLYGTTIAMYVLDINIPNACMQGTPRLVTTFPERKNSLHPYVNACHVQLNPVNIEEFSFCHGYNEVSSGDVLAARVWYGKTDGSLVRMTSLVPKGRIQTHEIWGPLGKFMYVVEMQTDGKGNVVRIDPRTGELKTIVSGTPAVNRCLHINMSGDEKKLVWDTQCRDPLDQYQNHLENITLYNVDTQTTTVLARQLEGLNHPRHMHPNMTKDGSKVAFTVAEGSKSKVAFVSTQ